MKGTAQQSIIKGDACAGVENTNLGSMDIDKTEQHNRGSVTCLNLEAYVSVPQGHVTIAYSLALYY